MGEVLYLCRETLLTWIARSAKLMEIGDIFDEEAIYVASYIATVAFPVWM